MIPLERTRTDEAITRALRGYWRRYKVLKLLRGRRDGALEFHSRYWKPAKDQLVAESAQKCAYCEADTRAVAHGDVEHYRPKSVYWWLAYCYDNYLFACQICNQTYKGNAFPVSGAPLEEPTLPPDPTDEALEAMVDEIAPDPLDPDAVEAYLALHHAEAPHIPNPYVDDVEALYRWRADDVLREVEIEPRDDSDEATRAFEAARDHLGLNRDELKRLRWDRYEELSLHRRVLAIDDLAPSLREDIAARIRTMKARTSPFAGMVRWFVDRWELEVGDED